MTRLPVFSKAQLPALRRTPAPSEGGLRGSRGCAQGRIWTVVALGCLAAAPLQAQQRDAAAIALVQDAAFEHWWPKYERLMRTLRENQEADPGRLKVPAPRPEDLRREIHTGPGLSNHNLPGYTFYGVHTLGAVFEGLFLMDPAGSVAVLVNHDDPEARKPVLEDAYVDRMNRILQRAEVTLEGADQAVSLARFFLSTFFNFTLHPEGASIDAGLQDELQRVRLLNSYREIPQGRRELKFGDRKAFLVFAPVPPGMRTAIKPPVVLASDPRSFKIQLFTWHPLRGEVKSWDILIQDDQFVFFRDYTVGRWKPYHFEGMR